MENLNLSTCLKEPQVNQKTELEIVVEDLKKLESTFFVLEHRIRESVSSLGGHYSIPNEEIATQDKPEPSDYILRIYKTIRSLNNISLKLGVSCDRLNELI